ncbi:hypothetical protein DFJ73DRAFT_872625 [Zopfochytrium polystomum]|nr:hypothetical protein DFJ73DRAFT_872625 [Zopfochytrium polystomum]
MDESPFVTIHQEEGFEFLNNSSAEEFLINAQDQDPRLPPSPPAFFINAEPFFNFGQQNYPFPLIPEFQSSHFPPSGSSGDILPSPILLEEELQDDLVFQFVREESADPKLSDTAANRFGTATPAPISLPDQPAEHRVTTHSHGTLDKLVCYSPQLDSGGTQIMGACNWLSDSVRPNSSPPPQNLCLEALAQIPSPAISHTSSDGLQAPFCGPCSLFPTTRNFSTTTPASSVPSSPNSITLLVESATHGVIRAPLTQSAAPNDVFSGMSSKSPTKNSSTTPPLTPQQAAVAIAASEKSYFVSPEADIVLRPQPSTYNKWSAEEDALLRRAVAIYGPHGRWAQIATLVPKRTPIQCSTRWTGALNSKIHKGKWNPEEDALLLRGYRAELSRLRHSASEQSSSDSAKGRTVIDEINWAAIAEHVPGRTAVQCVARYQEALDPTIRKGKWSAEEDELLKVGIATHGKSWVMIAEMVPGRTQRQCRTRWLQMRQRLERNMAQPSSGTPH